MYLKIKRFEPIIKYKEFFLFWVLISFAWVPYWLIYYPGIAAYDYPIQWIEYWTGSYRTWHPILHTLFMGTFIRAGRRVFGDYQRGMAFMTLVQMLIISSICAYAFWHFNKITNKIWKWVTLLFLMLFPVFPILSISTTKDSLFASFFLGAMVELDNILKQESNVFVKIRLIVFLVLAILFRNNMLYALAFMLLIMACNVVCKAVRARTTCEFDNRGLPKTEKTELLMTSHCERKVIHLLLVSIILGGLCSRMLTIVTKAEPGPLMEAYSLPCQQLARTYLENEETMDPELKESILYYWTDEDLHTYKQQISDPIKFSINREHFLERRSEFFSLWIKTFFRYPRTYVEAFLYTIQPMWNLFDRSMPTVHGFYIETFAYCPDSVGELEDTVIDIHRDSFFPNTEAWITEIIGNSRILNVPMLRLLFIPAFYFWVELIVFSLMVRKKKASAILGLVLISYWFTMTLGPCIVTRYVFSLILGLPMLIKEYISP